MQNSKLPLALLFLGLALLTYQFITHPTPQEQGLTKRFFIGKGDLAEDAMNKDFQSSPHKPKVDHHEVAGLAPAAPLAPSQAVVPAVAPTAAPLDLKALAKANDDKTKTEDKKKKKKKKKTVSPFPETTAQVQAPQAPVVPAPAEVPPAPVAATPPTPGSTSTGGLDGGANSVTASKDKSAIQYYENLLLKDPNSSETQKFVAAYKAKQIDDTVYFTVAAAMLADSRVQMKDLAVYVYGQATNLKSFEAFISVLDTDTSNDALKTDSLKYLNTYSDVTATNTMAVLGQALGATSTSPNLHLEALKLLDTATKQYAQLESTQTILSVGQVSAQSFTPTNAQKIFVPFLTLLSNIAHTSNDASTKTIATQDAGDIQSLIGTESASINQ